MSERLADIGWSQMEALLNQELPVRKRFFLPRWIMLVLALVLILGLGYLAFIDDFNGTKLNNVQGSSSLSISDLSNEEATFKDSKDFTEATIPSENKTESPLPKTIETDSTNYADNQNNVSNYTQVYSKSNNKSSIAKKKNDARVESFKEYATPVSKSSDLTETKTPTKRNHFHVSSNQNVETGNINKNHVNQPFEKNPISQAESKIGPENASKYDTPINGKAEVKTGQDDFKKLITFGYVTKPILKKQLCVVSQNGPVNKVAISKRQEIINPGTFDQKFCPPKRLSGGFGLIQAGSKSGINLHLSWQAPASERVKMNIGLEYESLNMDLNAADHPERIGDENVYDNALTFTTHVADANVPASSFVNQISTLYAIILAEYHVTNTFSVLGGLKPGIQTGAQYSFDHVNPNTLNRNPEVGTSGLTGEDFIVHKAIGVLDLQFGIQFRLNCRLSANATYNYALSDYARSIRYADASTLENRTDTDINRRFYDVDSESISGSRFGIGIRMHF